MEHLPFAELISGARQRQGLSLNAVARGMHAAAQREGTHCATTEGIAWLGKIREGRGRKSWLPEGCLEPRYRVCPPQCSSGASVKPDFATSALETTSLTPGTVVQLFSAPVMASWTASAVKSPAR